ncbi:hypothetical protein POVCU1_026780, partial [Plasmodium ovale curtisi]
MLSLDTRKKKIKKNKINSVVASRPYQGTGEETTVQGWDRIGKDTLDTAAYWSVWEKGNRCSSEKKGEHFFNKGRKWKLLLC